MIGQECFLYLLIFFCILYFAVGQLLIFTQKQCNFENAVVMKLVSKLYCTGLQN